MKKNLSKKNKVATLITAMLSIVCGSIVVVIWLMYSTAMEHEKKRLYNSARAHVTFIENINQVELEYNPKISEEKVLEKTLAQIRLAYTKLSSFGLTGEYLIARKKEETIRFIFSNREKQWGLPQPVPLRDSPLAEPMRRALFGREGITVAPDYLGKTVVAAYEPLKGFKTLKLGLVVKRHLKEIRAPFVNISLVGIVTAILLIVVGTIVIIKTVNPMLLSLSKQAEALKQQKEMTNGIIETANDAIIVIDEWGVIQRCNGATGKMFGYRQEELLKQNVSMLMPSSIAKDHDGYINHYKKTGEKKIIGIGREIVAKHKEGTEFPIFLLVSEIKLEREKFFVGFIRNITKDKESLTQIQKANEQLKKQMKLNDQQVWTMEGLSGLENTIRNEKDENKAAKNVSSYLAKYLDAQITTLYLVKEEKLYLTGSYAFSKRKSLGNIIEFGEGFLGQAALEKELISVTDIPENYTRINSSIGDIKPINIVVLPFVYNDMVVGCIELGSFREISDTKLDFLKLISGPLAANFNSLMEQRKTQELLLKTQKQAQELEKQQQELTSANEELQASQAELQAQSDHLQKSNIELEEKTQALAKQKAQVEEKNKAIKAAQESIEKKAQELKLASKYKSEFLANMSHELRTPLNSLLILSKLLMENSDKNLNNSQIESATAIYNSGQDLLHIINDILDLSKVEAGKLDIHIEKVKLAAVVDKLQQQFAPIAAKKKIEFHCEIGRELSEFLKTDFKRLKQILKNLLSNAFKFTSIGSVVLKIHRADASAFEQKTIAFSVVDTGIGIPQKKQEAIFGAFQQADGSINRVYGGTGLGLAISKELARLLGGEIDLESSEGKGSKFTLYLPEQTEKVESKSMPVVISENKTQKIENRPTVISKKQSTLTDDRQHIAKGDKSILIIEDDHIFANTLMKILQEKGYKCLVAENGASGLQLALAYNPQGIILDLGLPDIDGYQLLEQFKFDLRTRHIPIHIVSAQDKNLLSLTNGAVGHLTKPATIGDIDAILDKFEQITNNKTKSVLLVEDDENSCSAITKLISGEDVHVTPATNGRDAIEQLKTKRFDCVILDLNLPDMTGFELLKKLPELLPQVPPVIIYTGKELTEEEYLELNKYTTTIVVKGADSPERLLQETTLFLHSAQAQLSKQQRQIIQILHNPREMLLGRKILLVDDDIRNVFAMCAALEKYDMEVITAENGQKALDILTSEENIELVIIDIMMPVMDGYEAIRKIRKQPQFAKLPIIALTAKAMREERDICIDTGASSYMAKPVDIDKLLTLIRMWFSIEK